MATLARLKGKRKMASTDKKFSTQTEKVMASAIESAIACGFQEVHPENILFAILKTECIAREIAVHFCTIANTTLLNLSNQVSNCLQVKSGKNPSTKSDLPLSSVSNDVMRLAKDTAGKNSICTNDILCGLVKINSTASMILNFLGMDSSNVSEEIIKILATQKPEYFVPPPLATPVTAKPSIPQSTCGSGSCGCTDSISSPNKTDQLKPSLDRQEWHRTLDIALDIASQSGLTVAAAFMQVVVSDTKALQSEKIRRIRSEMLGSVVDILLNQKI